MYVLNTTYILMLLDNVLSDMGRILVYERTTCVLKVLILIFSEEYKRLHFLMSFVTQKKNPKCFIFLSWVALGIYTY